MADAVVLCDDGFQDAELLYPYYRLQEAGFRVRLAGREAGDPVQGKYGYKVTPDTSVRDVRGAEVDVLVVPGGWAPDRMRTDSEFVRVVKEAMQNGRVVAAICHAGSLLVEADVVKGRQVTSYPAIRKDLENAGAKWTDAEVVVDGDLVTSRKPDDLPAWMRETLKLAKPTITA